MHGHGSALNCGQRRGLGQLALLLVFMTATAKADDDAPPPPSRPATQARAAVGLDSKAPTPWVVIPGGIADPAGGVAYVASASDGIEALDLNTGRSQWETKEAILPMALDGHQLIAQAPRGQSKVNSMQLVLIDTAGGQVVMQTQPIVFPDWVSVDGGIGLSFNSTAAIAGNELVLTWIAQRELVGTAPNREAVAAAHKVESGIARVSLDNGSSDVAVDEVPKPLRSPRGQPYYDVAEIRLTATESTENLAGGMRLVHRQLEARDRRTGRPLWHHEIAGDVILSAVPATAKAPNGRQGPQR